MQLTKKQERIMHQELMAVLKLPIASICYECGSEDDNNQNRVEYIWFNKTFSQLIKDFIKTQDLLDIDDGFKSKWVLYHNDNAIVLPICYECQYEQG